MVPQDKTSTASMTSRNYGEGTSVHHNLYSPPGIEKSALYRTVRHSNNDTDDDMLVVKNSLWGTGITSRLQRYQQENLGQFVTFDESRSGNVNVDGESSRRQERFGIGPNGRGQLFK